MKLSFLFYVEFVNTRTTPPLIMRMYICMYTYTYKNVNFYMSEVMMFHLSWHLNQQGISDKCGVVRLTKKDYM